MNVKWSNIPVNHKSLFTNIQYLVLLVSINPGKFARANKIKTILYEV